MPLQYPFEPGFNTLENAEIRLKLEMKWDPNPGKTFGSSVPPQIDEMGTGPGPDTTDERRAGLFQMMTW